MHLKCDYTNCDSGEKKSTERAREGKEADNCSSKENLELFLEYCRIRDAQFDIYPSQLKRERLFECYEQLKKMAFIHNGKVILDIDEKIMKAKLTYWSKWIVLYCDKSADSKSVFWDFLKDCEIVYLEEETGGIQICAEVNLFDEIQIKDESSALLKLRQLIGKNGDRKV